MKVFTIEVGERAARTGVMENTGTAQRRLWWVVSAAVLSACSEQRAA